MGFEVVVEDEIGGRVEALADPTNVLHRVLPAPDDPAYRCLGFVDRYGDTIFNRRQAECVLVELEALANSGHGIEDVAFLRRLTGMVGRCVQEPHLYLKFYGD